MMRRKDNIHQYSSNVKIFVKSKDEINNTMYIVTTLLILNMKLMYKLYNPLFLIIFINIYLIKIHVATLFRFYFP